MLITIDLIIRKEITAMSGYLQLKIASKLN